MRGSRRFLRVITLTCSRPLRSQHVLVSTDDAVRDQGAWSSGYRRTPRPEPERANCRRLQAGAWSPVAPHSRSAATRAAAGRRGVDRSISSVACRRMTDACSPISQLAQDPSAPAAAAASSARVPRRQNAGRQGGLTYRTVEELVRGILRSLGELQPAVSDPARVRIDCRYLFWIARDTMSARWTSVKYSRRQRDPTSATRSSQ
jgi:hypothetical protein